MNDGHEDVLLPLLEPLKIERGVFAARDEF